MPYPIAPGRRMAWDADGTVVIYAHDDLVSDPSRPMDTPADVTVPLLPVSEGEQEAINNEEGANGRLSDDSTITMVWLFPEPRDLKGYFVAGSGAHGGSTIFGYSQDTSNGQDGVWTQLKNEASHGAPAGDDWRTEMDIVNLTSVLGLFLSVSTGRYNWDHAWINQAHFYGSIAAGQTPDKLIFLDGASEFTSPLDYGDAGRGGLDVSTVTLRNDAATATIEGVVVEVEDIYGGSAAWYDLSLDNVTYNPTLALGDLAAGSETLIYVRQQIPELWTPLGALSARLKASHTAVT